MKVSLCMIIKNEADNLDFCLASVQGAVDEIIIIARDTADNREGIARDFGAQVVKWQGNLNDACNEALAMATGDWILFLDGNEQLASESVAALPLIIEDESISGFFLRLETYLDDGTGEEIGSDRVFRLFRNRSSSE